MCGILAMYSAREPILADTLRRATLRLSHRGPDGQKTWVADDRRVGLGHARLSIIDLATGDQPIVGDRMEMAHSIEGRLPFLDHHVVELVRDFPVVQKIRGMTEKYVLREAARPVLTATVYGRHKHPFLTPPPALAPGERLHELVQETLRGPALASLPFYDRAKVVTLLDGLPGLGGDARTALDPVLMVLLSACGLQERYNL